MIPIECFSYGKDIALQFNVDGERLSYAGRVNDVDRETFSIEIQDEGFRERSLPDGLTALLLTREKSQRFHLPVSIENTENFPLLRVKQRNERAHIRADGFIRLRYKCLPEEDFLRKKDLCLNHAAPEYLLGVRDPRTHYGLGADTDMGPIPLRYLSEVLLLNKKLLALQQIISNPNELEIFENDPLEVNMSGSGMKFMSVSPLKVGDLVELNLVLPTAPFSIIKAVGLVLRRDKQPKRTSPTEHSHPVAVKFLVLNENNRELIIQCVFSWHRKKLRNFKKTYSA
jgi:hypothetical protein